MEYERSDKKTRARSPMITGTWRYPMYADYYPGVGKGLPYILHVPQGYSALKRDFGVGSMMGSEKIGKNFDFWVFNFWIFAGQENLGGKPVK